MEKLTWLGITIQILLIILRISNVLQWDWLWILSPLWIFGGFCAVLFICWQIAILLFNGIET